MDEIYEGKTVSSLLGQSLVDDDSPYANLFTDEERKEFIYHLFRRCVLGGPLCQGSDNLNDYLGQVKELYKEMMTVHKNRHNVVEIPSRVYLITNIDSEESHLFSNKSVYNACYVILHPQQHHVTCWTLSHPSFW